MSNSRVLVAVSSPWAGEKLGAPIADLAHRLDAQVVVAHVTQVQEEDQHESDATQRAEQILQTLCEELRQKGVEADEVMLFSDDTAKAILNTARARQCTLIVLGLTGKNLLKRLLTGDVPATLLRQTDLPVLLCPSIWEGKI